MVYAQLDDQASARKSLNAAVASPVDSPGKDEARKTLASLRWPPRWPSAAPRTSVTV